MLQREPLPKFRAFARHHNRVCSAHLLNVVVCYSLPFTAAGRAGTGIAKDGAKADDADHRTYTDEEDTRPYADDEDTRIYVDEEDTRYYTDDLTDDADDDTYITDQYIAAPSDDEGKKVPSRFYSAKNSF